MSSQDESTFEHLFAQSKFTPEQKADFLKELNTQLRFDNHDIALEERLEIITTCFDKNVGSIILLMPNGDEPTNFLTCVRKFARTKMRTVSYYH